MQVDPIPANGEEHKAAFQACVDYFQPETEEFGFTFDSGSDVSRLCFLAHYPNAKKHENAHAIKWDIAAYQKTQAAKAEKPNAKIFVGKADLEALDFVPNDCDYETWRNVGMAIKDAGFGVDVFQKWSDGQRKRSTGEWVTEDIQAHWNRYNFSGITWATVVHLAREHGYKPPSKKRNRNLKVDAEYQRDISDIDSERAAVRTGLDKWIQETEGKENKLLNITTAAGTGKSTIIITTAEKLLYVAKTTEEADQAFSISEHETERTRWRHRPRLFNRDRVDWETLPLGLGENERPCIQPEICNDLAAAGHSTKVVCETCPERKLCKDAAYLSQEGIEQVSEQVFYAEGEAFLSDWIYRERVKRLTDDGKLLALDEGVPSRLPMERKISLSNLAELAERFRLPERLAFSEMLKQLTASLATATTA